MCNYHFNHAKICYTVIYVINLCIVVLCAIATTVVDDTLFYNVTAFNGFIINQEHDAIAVLILVLTDYRQHATNRVSNRYVYRSAHH